MELGNMLFGAGTGQQYAIDRERFGDLFYELLEKYMFLNRTGYIDEIVTDTFEVRPYYWGDCTCDFDTVDINWCKSNSHKDNCYQTELQALKKQFGTKFDYNQNESVELRKKFNLQYKGCAVHCTCGYDEKWIQFLKERGCTHTKDCEIAKPNFCYKPTNLVIEWYKYPLRDSYSNRLFDEKELEEIFKKCYKSYVSYAVKNQKGYLHKHEFLDTPLNYDTMKKQIEFEDTPQESKNIQRQIGTTIVNCWFECKYMDNKT